MNVLFLDCETTGLSPPEHRVIEIGAVLWNVEERAIVDCFSALLYQPDNPAEPFNGISVRLLKQADLPGEAEAAWMVAEDLASRADAVLAHSAAFDYKFVAHERQGVVEHLLRVPWICTLEDVDWPKVTRLDLGRAGSGSLIRLALAHGVAITSAHRAIHDCLLLARLCEVVPDIGARLDAALLRAQRPKASFIAMVPVERNNEGSVRERGAMTCKNGHGGVVERAGGAVSCHHFVALVDRTMYDQIEALGFNWSRRGYGYWWKSCTIEEAERFSFPVAYEEDYLRHLGFSEDFLNNSAALKKTVRPNLEAFERRSQEAYDRTWGSCCRKEPPPNRRTAWLQEHGRLCKQLTKNGWRRSWQCRTCLRHLAGDGINAGPPTQELPNYIEHHDPRRKRINEELRAAWERQKPKNRREAWFADHNLYLNSTAWKQLRAKVLERDGHRCVDCGVPAEHVHHLTYDRWQQELLEDLVSLCKKCHDRRHEEE